MEYNYMASSPEIFELDLTSARRSSLVLYSFQSLYAVTGTCVLYKGINPCTNRYSRGKRRNSERLSSLVRTIQPDQALCAILTPADRRG